MRLKRDVYLKTVCRIVFFMSMFGVSLASGAKVDDSEVVTKEQLKVLKQEIEALKEILADAKQKRGQVQQELQKTEQSINTLNREIDDIKSKISEQEQQLNSTKDQELKLLQRLADDKLTLAKGVKLAYLKPLTNPVKILLNQQRPEQALRMLSYYNYLAKAQSERIKATTKRLYALKQIQDRVNLDAQRLAALEQSLVDRSVLLKAEKSKQQLIIAALAKRVTSGTSKLTQLTGQQNALERLLAELRSQLVLKQEEAFIKRKGELPWPLEGSLVNRFGDDKLSGKMRWNGVFIKSKQASLVKAVHYGQVVFSDWFKGFGKLIIVDHGEGFMSVYANNSRLIHKAGDWVAPGEPVAVVGKSSEDGRTGLYFELRREGQPYDPLPWLRNSG